MSFVSYEDDAVAVAAGGSSGLTTLILPSNLDQLDKEDLSNLLKRVVSEVSEQLDKEDVVNLLKEMVSKRKNDLSTELTKQTKKPRLNNNDAVSPCTKPSSEPDNDDISSSKEPSSAPVKFVSPCTKPSSEPNNDDISACTESSSARVKFDVINSKKFIFKKATSLIKETTHTDNGKPYTSVSLKVTTEGGIMKIMNGYEPTTITNTFVRWILEKEEVLDWLNIRDTPHIHPVANQIKRHFAIYGSNTTNEVYVHAGIENVDIKWKRKSGTLDLKFRTRIVATGNPKHSKDIKPWSIPAPAFMMSQHLNVIGIKKFIFKNATAEIKKTLHRNISKPYTSFVVNVSSEARIMALMNGYELITNFNDHMRWNLKHEQVLDWLNIHETPNIHPVANKMYGFHPKGCDVYVHAGIESVDIKWSRKFGTLALKFRTFVAGTGQSFVNYDHYEFVCGSRNKEKDDGEMSND